MPRIEQDILIHQIKITGIDQPVFLISYDASGNEAVDATGVLTSQQAVNVLNGGTITDVFIFSHGWLSDYPEAVTRYTQWVGAMAACTQDRTKIQQVRPGFLPLLVGIHWPSLPFAEKELGGPGVSAADFGLLDLFSLADDYATRLVDTVAGAVTSAATTAVTTVRDTLGPIIAEATKKLLPDSLPQDVVSAYNQLNNLTSLVGSGDVSSSPNADRNPFDPQTYYAKALEAINAFKSDLETLGEGDAFLGGILAPLRMLSFWKMKDRAFRSAAVRVLSS